MYQKILKIMNFLFKAVILNYVKKLKIENIVELIQK